jgi:hypothetical protein
MVECVEIEVGHQFGLDVVHGFRECLEELVEILLVKEDLMPVVTIVIETFTALRDGKIIIVPAGSPHIEEIGTSFTCADAFAVDAIHALFVVVVCHSVGFSFGSYSKRVPQQYPI